MADTNRTQIRYVEETTWGTTPSSALKEFRDTGDSLSFKADSITSKEIRSDRQITDQIQTGANPGGGLNFELSYGGCDDFFEGALFSDWGTAVNISATDIAAVASTNSYDSTSTSFSGISAGQWIRVTGFSTSGNNGYCQVTSVSTNSIVVTGLTLTDESAGDTISMVGTTLRNGTTEKSYSIEREHADITQFFSFTGMEVNTMKLSVAANSIVTGSFDFIGKDAARSTSTIGTGSPTAAPTNDVLNGVANVAQIREGGDLMTDVFIQSLDLNLANNIRGLAAIGCLGNADLGAGECNVNGTMNVYFASGDLYDKFINQTETSLSFKLEDSAGSNYGNAYIITIPRLQFSSDDISVPGSNQDVMENLGWQALRHSTYDFTIQIDKFDHD